MQAESGRPCPPGGSRIVGEDAESAQAAAAVRQGSVQQDRPDRRSGGNDGQHREAPQQIPSGREHDAGERPSIIGRPGTGRIVTDEVSDDGAVAPREGGGISRVLDA
jgi:hypothetical protein